MTTLITISTIASIFNSTTIVTFVVLLLTGKITVRWNRR